ncbi:hypothetical protein D1871_13940 [Nakamurella silvestris]|nr:hypothetical protein D1871_13940 [Nakamurella silvestris]
MSVGDGSVPADFFAETPGTPSVNEIVDQEVVVPDLDLELPPLPESVWLRAVANALDPDAPAVSDDIVPDPSTESPVDAGELDVDADHHTAADHGSDDHLLGPDGAGEHHIGTHEGQDDASDGSHHSGTPDAGPHQDGFSDPAHTDDFDPASGFGSGHEFGSTHDFGGDTTFGDSTLDGTPEVNGDSGDGHGWLS